MDEPPTTIGPMTIGAQQQPEPEPVVASPPPLSPGGRLGELPPFVSEEAPPAPPTVILMIVFRTWISNWFAIRFLLIYSFIVTVTVVYSENCDATPPNLSPIA
jgi:hypothetical protein